jgi:T6SS, Phospholipase effector Tle1-like, catalytic domain
MVGPSYEETGFSISRLPKSKRLVLCFDGTSDKFSADETDSNIVKIYELLDRESPDQYHSYQRQFFPPPNCTNIPFRTRYEGSIFRDHVLVEPEADSTS